MSTHRCPSCGDEFLATVTVCPDCRVALVGGPSGEGSSDIDDDLVSFTVLDGDDEARRLLVALLSGEGIAHELTGDALVVDGDDADRVDDVLDRLDAELGLVPPDDVPLVALEFHDWDDDSLDLLAGLLRRARVPHEWEDDGSLLVEPEHEAAANELADRVQHPDALDEEPDDPEAQPELLGEFFVAADRLKSEPRSPGAAVRIADLLDATEGLSSPYGVSDTVWGDILQAAGDAVEAALSESSDDEAVREASERLRDLLRPLV